MLLLPAVTLPPVANPVAPLAVTPIRELATVPATPPNRIAGPAFDATRAAARLSDTPVVLGPIVDFPGIAAGQEFSIVDGSKAGPIGVRGDARIDRFDDDHATFHVKAGRFGFKVDVTVDVERIDATTVRISSRGSGIPDQTAIGRILESRTNYASFEQVDDTSRHTVISRGDDGLLVIDADVPTVGHAHLVLEPRGAVR